MAGRSERTGRAAAPGRFSGPAWRRGGEAPSGLPVGRPEVEAARLAEALARAGADIQRLAGAAGADGAAILDFQLEMLSDPDLLTEVHAAIAGGMGAGQAWSDVLERAMAGFGDSGDEALSARVPDLADIKSRVLAALAGRAPDDFPPGHVFVGHDLEPSRFLAHDWSRQGAVVLAAGSAASHVAMLARARGVPMLVATDLAGIATGDRLAVDGSAGRLSLDPKIAPDADAPLAPAPVADPLPHSFRLADGSLVTLSINVNDHADLDRARGIDHAGIGLVRSEFLVASDADRRDRAAQAAIYRDLLRRAKGRPVAIRLFDFGGDKPAPDTAGAPSERRGLRWLMDHPDLLSTQLAALVEAAPHGALSILAPMVTVPSELAALRRMLVAEAERHAPGQPAPKLGMMVEVPAAALSIADFEADLLSIGTNDLGQFLACAGRQSDAEQDLVAESRPALLRLVGAIAASAARTGTPLTVCGDMAGDPALTADLLAAGIRHFSAAPASLPGLKAELIRLGAVPHSAEVPPAASAGQGGRHGA